MTAKTVHIVIGLTLIVATTGVTISQHICGDRVDYTQFATGSQPGDCCGDGMMKMTCCHNEVSTNQITDEFSAAPQVQAQDLQFLAVLPSAVAAAEHQTLQISGEYAYLSRDCASLYGRSVSISVLNQSFLI